DRLQGRMQGWGDDLLHPAQAFQHTGIVRPVAQHFPQALIQRAVGPVPMRTVFHHHEWHTGCDDAGHWSDSAEAVTGLPGDPPRLHEALCLVQVSGTAFVRPRPKHGTAHGAAHGFPHHWWTSVQESVLTELRQQLTGRTDSHQIWPGRKDTLQRLLISGIYR